MSNDLSKAPATTRRERLIARVRERCGNRPDDGGGFRMRFEALVDRWESLSAISDDRLRVMDANSREQEGLMVHAVQMGLLAEGLLGRLMRRTLTEADYDSASSHGMIPESISTASRELEGLTDRFGIRVIEKLRAMFPESQTLHGDAPRMILENDSGVYHLICAGVDINDPTFSIRVGVFNNNLDGLSAVLAHFNSLENSADAERMIDTLCGKRWPLFKGDRYSRLARLVNAIETGTIEDFLEMVHALNEKEGRAETERIERVLKKSQLEEARQKAFWALVAFFDEPSMQELREGLIMLRERIGEVDARRDLRARIMGILNEAGTRSKLTETARAVVEARPNFMSYAGTATALKRYNVLRYQMICLALLKRHWEEEITVEQLEDELGKLGRHLISVDGGEATLLYPGGVRYSIRREGIEEAIRSHFRQIRNEALKMATALEIGYSRLKASMSDRYRSGDEAGL